MAYFDINPFVIFNSPQGRLTNWKALRQKIAELSDDEAMAIVAEYWAHAPMSNFSYNPDDCESWPSPWEMVSAGDWCPQMVAVAMEFSLRLSGWEANRLELVAFRDYDISQEVMVLKIDDKYALNYSIGKVEGWPDTKKIITGKWSFQGRSYKPSAT